MSIETIMSEAVRAAMESGARHAMLQCVDLLLEASQVKGMPIEDARGYLNAARVIGEFHRSLYPPKGD